MQVAPVGLGRSAPASILDRSSRSSTIRASRTPSPSITSSSSERSASVTAALRRAEPAVVIAVSGERRSCEIAWRIAVRATSARCVASASAARWAMLARSTATSISRPSGSARRSTSLSAQPLSVDRYSQARRTRA